MSHKAKQTLLFGGGKKTAAEKVELKHNPEQEFRDSIGRHRDPDAPTLIGFPAPGVKGAMMTGALRTAGVKKTEVAQLVTLPAYHIPIYGTPLLKMDVVRSADIGRTPDVRTRGFMEEWCSEFAVRYIVPQLSAETIVNLLANAGLTCGIGDFRQEKGKGSFGLFSVHLVDEKGEMIDDQGDATARWNEITSGCDRASQEHALANPVPADPETFEMMQLLQLERARRAA